MHSKTAHNLIHSYRSIYPQNSIHFVIHHDPFFPSSTTSGTAGTSTSTSHFIPT